MDSPRWTCRHWTAGCRDRAPMRRVSHARLKERHWSAKISDMDKSAIISEIRAHRPLFEAQGITHVYLFGSVMRNEHGDHSDVDLFFDHAIPDFGAFAYVGLKQMAQDAL